VLLKNEFTHIINCCVSYTRVVIDTTGVAMQPRLACRIFVYVTHRTLFQASRFQHSVAY